MHEITVGDESLVNPLFSSDVNISAKVVKKKQLALQLWDSMLCSDMVLQVSLL